MNYKYEIVFKTPKDKEYKSINWSFTENQKHLFINKIFELFKYHNELNIVINKEE